ncbi:hypothetical protein TREMEDRAFT_66375 [Tremella mesenterica DSM 1558]|uniref:uncharacterized protein n=1 Tax=Tremella mesenterica (strain ATCC 24925 / CBS 8224 / DSM 1558 / NBRC 9311 / NRRL Y-6157 / RJB 2259-6 / UBC 559-6) TaxID=578456 RepID=UPI00032BC55B|nr:uncharacterized protein TREMEDRAFT_66375 [Tremella mesenterica DSM 1558]EIW65649.1 hypothetical protein TREMEDRAFT_66375 [Tremella mesenterica DSM 1558]
MSESMHLVQAGESVDLNDGVLVQLDFNVWTIPPKNHGLNICLTYKDKDNDRHVIEEGPWVPGQSYQEDLALSFTIAQNPHTLGGWRPGNVPISQWSNILSLANTAGFTQSPKEAGDEPLFSIEEYIPPSKTSDFGSNNEDEATIVPTDQNSSIHPDGASSHHDD